MLGLSIHCLLVGTHTQGLQFEVSSMVDPPFLGCLKLFGEAKISLRFLFGYLSSVDGSDFASFGVFEVENYVLFHQTGMNTLGICPNMKWRKISFINNARFHATWKKRFPA